MILIILFTTKLQACPTHAGGRRMDIKPGHVYMSQMQVKKTPIMLLLFKAYIINLSILKL